MSFENRAQAAQMLAGRLEKYRGQHPLVLAIPRGAVPMEKILADALDGDLDVVLVRKLRAPQNPEHHFRDFSQVSDDEVVTTLREARRAPVPASPSA